MPFTMALVLSGNKGIQLKFNMFTGFIFNALNNYIYCFFKREEQKEKWNHAFLKGIPKYTQETYTKV